ncbi:MAG: YiiX/YebB-like N1pC/P60 family cysteine hydrolase [Chitinophagaceae bacterium]
MAQSLTIKELQQFPPRKYKIIRNDLQTGDLIFCSGNYFFSKLIQKFTKSVWSHVGIVYRDEALGRILILESEKIFGVRFAPLSKYLKDYHGKNKPYKGKIVVARINPQISITLLQNAISYGMDELTKPYDNWEVIRIGIRTIFGITRRENNRNYICSELVQECFKKAGITFNDNDTKISPDDIWNDEKLEFLYRLL